MNIDDNFAESTHTADLAIHVHGSDFPELLRSAAAGMYALMGLAASDATPVNLDLAIPAADPESMLIDLLNELLYQVEQGLVPDLADLQLTPNGLSLHLRAARLLSQKRAIKAATFHNLRIQSTPAGLEAEIVFDV